MTAGERRSDVVGTLYTLTIFSYDADYECSERIVEYVARTEVSENLNHLKGIGRVSVDERPWLLSSGYRAEIRNKDGNLLWSYEGENHESDDAYDPEY